jgi:transcriptional regulator with XRE-family HTH domain
MAYTVKELRQAAGLTQLQLAYRSGVSLTAIMNAEREDGTINHSTLAKILLYINQVRDVEGLPLVAIDAVDCKLR